MQADHQPPTVNDAAMLSPSFSSSSDSSSSSGPSPSGFTFLHSIASSCPALPCSFCCGATPPLAHLASICDALTTRRVLLQLCVSELLYQAALLIPALYVLSQLATATPPQPALVLACSILLRTVVILALHARHPTLSSYYTRHLRLRFTLRLLTFAASAVVLGTMEDSESPWSSSLPTLAVVIAAVVEVYIAVMQLAVYCALHLYFPHAALTPLPPFIPVQLTFVDQWISSPAMAFPETSKLSAAGPTLSNLSAIPPLCYDPADAECEPLCVICMHDLQHGDAMRVFTCRHGFHVQCIDRWLIRRQVCPLCIAVVTIPVPKPIPAPM